MHKLIEIYLILFRFWMTFPEKLRFLLVGGYNTVFSYALYTLFLYLSNGSLPQIALAGSFFISSLNSYLTQKFFVFNTRGNYKQEYIRCLETWVISYFCNAGLLWLFIDCLKLNPYIAQIPALILVAVINYVLLKYFAFKKKH